MATAQYFQIIDQTTDDLIVSVADARRHLFIFDDDTSDAIIEQYLGAAQELVADWIGQPLVPTRMAAFYNVLDTNGLVLPHPTIRDVTLNYVDWNRVTQVISSAFYAIDTTDAFPKIYAPSGSYFAVGTNPVPINVNLTNPVQVTYTTQLLETVDTKFGAVDRIKQAILMYMSDLWNNRSDEETMAMNVKKTTVLTARRLLKKYRQPTL